MKKIIATLLALIMIFAFAACGEKEETTDDMAATETTTEAKEATTRNVTIENVLDVVAEDTGLSVAYFSEIKVKQTDGAFIVTFKYENEDCMYKISSTGEILEKTMPEVNTTSANPIEEAINASFAQLPDYHGGAENIKTSRDGNIVTVKFDWNGESHEYQYDLDAKAIIK